MYSDLREDLVLVRPHRKSFLFTSEIPQQSRSTRFAVYRFGKSVRIPLRRSLTHTAVVFAEVGLFVKRYLSAREAETSFYLRRAVMKLFNEAQTGLVFCPISPVLCLITPSAPPDAGEEEFH